MALFTKCSPILGDSGVEDFKIGNITWLFIAAPLPTMGGNLLSLIAS